jgi:hypothetical protein
MRCLSMPIRLLASKQPAARVLQPVAVLNIQRQNHPSIQHMFCTPAHARTHDSLPFSLVVPHYLLPTTRIRYSRVQRARVHERR